MDKANILNTFTDIINQLRNIECSQKEKITHFQRLHDCIVSPAMAAQLNYANHISRATNVLLLFCEDFDATVRMSAEENLNKIFRVLERTRVSRILMDLYGEIKRNGNQRSLRICLKLFAYYSSQIREQNLRWYAEHLLPCLHLISKRPETQLQETFSEFVAVFCQNIQHGLNDSETCKLFESFLQNIMAECAVVRRCSAQNCCSLIENASNKILMAKYALSKVFDILLADQQNHTVLGVLGFLRQLIPLSLSIFNNPEINFHCDEMRSTLKNNPADVNLLELQQIVQIYDYCLHCVGTTPLYNHSLINVSLEAINVILQCLNGLEITEHCINNADGLPRSNGNDLSSLLMDMIAGKNLKHLAYTNNKNSLKSQILTNLQTSINVTRNEETVEPEDDDSDLINNGVLKSQMHEQDTQDSSIRRDLKQRQQENKNENQKRRNTIVDDELNGKSQVSPLMISKDLKAAMASATPMTTLAVTETTSSCINDVSQQTTTTEHKNQEKKVESVQEHNEKTIIDNKCVGTSKKFILEASKDLNVDDSSEFINIIDEYATLDVAVAGDTVDSDASIISNSYNNNRVAGRTNEAAHAFAVTNTNNTSSEGFSSFFSNINIAASESVSKFFRVSTGQLKKSNNSMMSFETPSITSDNISINSCASDLKPLDLVDIELIDDINSLSSPDSTSKLSSHPTPSTAILGDICSMDSMDDIAIIHKMTTSNDDNVEKSKRPFKNPFLITPGSPVKDTPFCDVSLPMDIGTPNNQSLLYYTARLVTRRFLLTGTTHGLYNESAVRVSIKNSSLNVLTQCVRLAPELLHMPMKLLSNKLSSPEKFKENRKVVIKSENIDSLSEEHRANSVIVPKKKDLPLSSQSSDLNKIIENNLNEPLLEIKDDHFGKSSIDFNFIQMDQPLMTQSADTILLKPIKDSIVQASTSSPSSNRHNNKQSEILSLSERGSLFEGSSMSLEPPPKPPKRMKSLRKMKNIETPKVSEKSKLNECSSREDAQVDHMQMLSDILYYYNHDDPILRAGIQNIIGNYLCSCQAGCSLELQINLQYLLAIVCVGLEDEIHTVVMQALNTFEKIFPYVMLKYSIIIKATSSTVTTTTKTLTRKLSKQSGGHSPCKMNDEEPSGEQKQHKEYKQQSNDKHNRTDHTDDDNAGTKKERTASTTKASTTIKEHRDRDVTANVGEHKNKFILSEAILLPDDASSSSIDTKQIISNKISKAATTTVTKTILEKVEDGMMENGKSNSTSCGSCCRYTLDRCCCCCSLNRITRRHFMDNDEIILNLLNAFQFKLNFQNKYNNSNKNNNTNNNDIGNRIKGMNQHNNKEKNKKHQQLDNDHDHDNNDCLDGCSLATQNTDGKKSWSIAMDNDKQTSITATAIAKTKSIVLTAAPDSVTCDNNNCLNLEVSRMAGTVAQNVHSNQSNAEFTDQSKNTMATTSCCCCHLIITPTLLLNKLRLCYFNNYWLVKNKYAEVISNFNYTALAMYYDCCNAINNNNYNNSYYCYNNLTNEMINADDVINDLKKSFIEELLQLIGDDDVRVREQAAKCLCRLIIQNAKQDKLQYNSSTSTSTSTSTNSSSSSNNDKNYNKNDKKSYHNNWKNDANDATDNDDNNDNDDANIDSDIDDDCCDMSVYLNNFHLLTNFLSYSIFNDMTPALAYLYNDFSILTTTKLTKQPPPLIKSNSHLYKERINQELAQVLYQITNRLLNLKDKNLQFGLIYTIKILLENFNVADYMDIWREYNFVEILIKLSQYNYNTAVDLTCQNDLIDVSSKLIAGLFLLQPDDRKFYENMLLVLLKHSLKIVNIYYHLFTNQKPLTTAMAKGQKMDLFGGNINKELATMQQQLGYFAHDFIYMNLYQQLTRAYDNYRITINEEAGSKLISLLKSTFNALSACIELLPHADMHNIDIANCSSWGDATTARTSSRRTSDTGCNNASNVTPTTTLISRTLARTASGIAKNSPDIMPVVSTKITTATTSQQLKPIPATSSPSVNSSGSVVGAATASSLLSSSSSTSLLTSSVAGGTGVIGALVVVPALKLIEEILQYITRIINYTPEECIGCLRQLLKYLFSQNYGNKDMIHQQHQQQQQQQHQQHHQQQQQQQSNIKCHYPTFAEAYFQAKRKAYQSNKNKRNRFIPDDYHTIKGCQNIATRTAAAKTTAPTSAVSPPVVCGTVAATTVTAATIITETIMPLGNAKRPFDVNQQQQQQHQQQQLSSSTLMGLPNVLVASASITPSLSTATTSSSFVKTLDSLQPLDDNHNNNNNNNNNNSNNNNNKKNATNDQINRNLNRNLKDFYQLLLFELFASALEFHSWQPEQKPETLILAKQIKLFEPLVIYCITLFLKGNGKVQASILQLLNLLLNLKVNYTDLDSKNLIYNHIMKTLDNIENGRARNASYCIGPMIEFLMKLSWRHDCNLITIPKIISIVNNLLANSNIRQLAIKALNVLAYEIFLMASIKKNRDEKEIERQQKLQQQTQQQQQDITASSFINANYNSNTLNRKRKNSLSFVMANILSSSTTASAAAVAVAGASSLPSSPSPTTSLAAITLQQEQQQLQLQQQQQQQQLSQVQHYTNIVDSNELDTQKEVVLRMLEKFIESVDCQRVLSLLLLIEHLQRQQQQRCLLNVESTINTSEQQMQATTTAAAAENRRQILMTTKDNPTNHCHCRRRRTNYSYCCYLPNSDIDTVSGMLCHAICTKRVQIRDWLDVHLANAFYQNNVKQLLSNSRDFMALLKFILEMNAASLSELSYGTMVLSHVILKTEDIYLLNHIKLYLKNHPIKAENLNEKLPAAALPTTVTTLQWQPPSLDIMDNDDKPSTSMAAAATANATKVATEAAAGTAARTGPVTITATGIKNSVNEMNYLAIILYEALEKCLSVIVAANVGDPFMISSIPLSFNTSNRKFMIKYIKVATYFIHTLLELCVKSSSSPYSSDCFLFSCMRHMLAAYEEPLLQLYHKLLTLNACRGITTATTATATATSNSSSSSSSSSTSFPTASILQSYQQQQQCRYWPLRPLSLADDVDDVDEFHDAVDCVLQLQMKLFELLHTLKLLQPVTILQHLQQHQATISFTVKRFIVQQICRHFHYYYQRHRNEHINSIDWNLLQQQLLHNTFLNILIIDEFAFVCNACKADEEFCSLFQQALLNHLTMLCKSAIVGLLRLISHYCQQADCGVTAFVKFLKILCKLHELNATEGNETTGQRTLLMKMEYLAKRLVNETAPFIQQHKITIRNAFECFIKEAQESEKRKEKTLAAGESRRMKKKKTKSPFQGTIQSLEFRILNDLENCCYINKIDVMKMKAETETTTENNVTINVGDADGDGDGDVVADANSKAGAAPTPSNIIDEQWIFNQLIKLSWMRQSDGNNNPFEQDIVKILLQIQSDNKLYNIFNDKRFNVVRILRCAITSSLEAMLASFRNNCIQHNPHIHYMQLNPLARVSHATLINHIKQMLFDEQQQRKQLQQHQQRKQLQEQLQQQNNNDGDGDVKGKNFTIDNNNKMLTATVVLTSTTTTITTTTIAAAPVSASIKQHFLNASGEKIIMQDVANGDVEKNVMAAMDKEKKTAEKLKVNANECNQKREGIVVAGAGTGKNERYDDTVVDNDNDNDKEKETLKEIHLTEAVLALIENINCIEMTALIYVEWKFIEKFLREHLLRNDTIQILLQFMHWCCKRLQNLLSCVSLSSTQKNWVSLLLRCLNALLPQKFIWAELNQSEQLGKTRRRPTDSGGHGLSLGLGLNVGVDLVEMSSAYLNEILCSCVDVVVQAAILLLQNTLFYKKFKSNGNFESLKHKQHHLMLSYENPQCLASVYSAKIVFLAKLIETEIGQLNLTASPTYTNTHMPSYGSRIEFVNLHYHHVDYISMRELLLIGTSILRTHLFYAIAVTPHEIMQQCLPNPKLPTYGVMSATTNTTTTPVLKNTLNWDRSDDCHSDDGSGGGISAIDDGINIDTTKVTTTTATPTKFIPPMYNTSSLPSIPIECLSDVDVLRNFVKRSSIFGFTTRQQFEEYFMTFLLLINHIYDENMVDQQEQYQIRRICLEAIIELLITYKSFPIVGNRINSQYHHTIRWQRIHCDSISLKKLHEIQLIMKDSNVFYQSNLEGDLINDTLIGTQRFGPNQYDLNFIWQQMEAYNKQFNNNSPTKAEPNDSKGLNVLLEVISRGRGFTIDKISRGASYTGLTSASDTATALASNIAYKNFQYYTKLSGIDFKSSSQVLYDVLMQMLDQNAILILPIVMEFIEICENRDQVKQIYERAHYMQSHTPMDDTITHQYLIYLLCKTSAMLIPSLNDVQYLENLLKNYLKSSHVFVRCMTLNGLISLLECCSKTNGAIGKLSDELELLKSISFNYIEKYNGINNQLDKSFQCSDWHTKLLWTLNYCLMEWTSKLDPACDVPKQTQMAAAKLLRNTNNAEIYLCVLHGLERMIVVGQKSWALDLAGGQHQMLPCIEKLSLELAKMENERFSIPALKLLLSCIYMGSTRQLENTELSNGVVVHDDPEIIVQQTDKVDILLQCIKTATREAAWIYGRVLCQIIRDLVPPKEILTKVIKELLAINQPHNDVIAMIVFQVFRSAIDSSFLQQLQDWLTYSLPTLLALPQAKAVWSLTVVFLSATINLHLMKLFPLVLHTTAAMTTATTVTVSSATATTITKRKSKNYVERPLISSAATTTAAEIPITARTMVTTIASSSLSPSSSYLPSSDSHANDTAENHNASESTIIKEKKINRDVGDDDDDDDDFVKMGREYLGHDDVDDDNDHIAYQHHHFETVLFMTSAQDFYAKLNNEQRQRFRLAFQDFHHIPLYEMMLQSL